MLADILEKNLKVVREKIKNAALRSERDPEEITLVAVTKYVGPEEIKALAGLGVTEFGENRMQAAMRKIPEVGGQVHWHMIGHLQRNKVKKAVENFVMIHSVDSPRLAEEIAVQCEKLGKKMPVMIEMNISGEETKFGAAGDEAWELVKTAHEAKSLELGGLMTMAPYSNDPEDARPYFRNLRIARDEFQQRLGSPLPHLSMGMTGDFEVAIEEGATHLRIGSALYENISVD